ncbi:MAG: hypothetical protein ABIH49_01580 [archaeon]
MKKTNFIIFGMVFLFVILSTNLHSQSESEQYVYVVSLNSNQSVLSFDDVALSKGGLPNPEEGDYTSRIISSSGNNLYEMKFPVPGSVFVYGSPPNPDWFDDSGNQIYIPSVEESGSYELTSFPVILVLPYYPNAEKIEIYSPENELLLEVDVSRFALCSGEDCDIEAGSEEYNDALQEFLNEMDAQLLSQFGQQQKEASEFFGNKLNIPWWIYTLIGVLVVAVILTVAMVIRIFLKRKEEQFSNITPVW